MCLDIVESREFRAEEREGWKVFAIGPSGYIGLFSHTTHEPMQQGVWLKAKVQPVWTNKGHPYACGFHIFPNKEHAVRYAEMLRTFSSWHGQKYAATPLVVRKIKYKNTVASGTEFHTDRESDGIADLVFSVDVATDIMIVEETHESS